MITHQPKYSKEEFARRGDEIYDSDLRSLLEPKHNGQVVAIDIDSRAWEVDPDEMVAADRLTARCPEAQVWVVRVGSRYLTRFGFWRETRPV